MLTVLRSGGRARSTTTGTIVRKQCATVRKSGEPCINAQDGTLENVTGLPLQLGRSFCGLPRLSIAVLSNFRSNSTEPCAHLQVTATRFAAFHPLGDARFPQPDLILATDNPIGCVAAAGLQCDRLAVSRTIEKRADILPQASGVFRAPNHLKKATARPLADRIGVSA